MVISFLSSLHSYLMKQVTTVNARQQWLFCLVSHAHSCSTTWWRIPVLPTPFLSHLASHYLLPSRQNRSHLPYEVLPDFSFSEIL